MRWDDLFETLEAEAGGLERQHRDADFADRTRSAHAKVTWLLRCGSEEITVRLNGAGVLRGVPDTVTPWWMLLRTGESMDWVVSTSAVMSVTGLSDLAAPQSSAIDERLTWSHAWRVLGRDRSNVRVTCIDATVVEGVPDIVGRDYVQLRPYDGGRPTDRPPQAVPYAAIAAIRCPVETAGVRSSSGP